MAMEQQQQTEQPTSYEANATMRQRNFIARATAAVTGSVTGIFVGKYKLKQSLRHYLQQRLFARDWMHGHVEDSIVNMATGKSNTISGAITDPEKLDLWVKEWIKARDDKRTISLLGTLYGDEAANKALKDLFASQLVPNPNITDTSPHSHVLKDGFLKNAVDKYNTKMHELIKHHDGLMTKLEGEYFTGEKSVWTDALNKLKTDLAKEGITSVQRDAAFKEFEVLKVVKDEHKIHQYLQKESAIRENLKHFTNSAKMRIVDNAIYDEMMKAGTEAGRMGLKFRHSHDRGEILAFAAGAAVTVGYLTHKAVKSYLHRNEREAEICPPVNADSAADKKWADDKVKSVVENATSHAASVDKSRMNSSQQASVV